MGHRPRAANEGCHVRFMRTIADDRTLSSLVEHIRRLRPDTKPEESRRRGPNDLDAGHFMFGPMSARDWHRWAYRHVTYHLRQFDL